MKQKNNNIKEDKGKMLSIFLNSNVKIEVEKNNKQNIIKNTIK
tara:strand:+ start:50034 stop:50162 length:129 start_codon:yes stop_codon:yes gene_type:complete